MSYETGLFVSLAALATLLFTVLLFGVFLLVLYRLLRLVWARLPATALSLQGPDLDKLLGVVIALFIVSDVARYAWSTLVSLFDFFGVQIRRIAGSLLAGGPRCDEDLRCISEFGAQLAAIFGDIALGLVRALRLGDFPVTQFVLFLLIAIVATQAIGLIRHGIATRRIESWAKTADKWIPVETRQRVVFALLVVIAFYLGLSALLAIPLFQDKSRPQNLNVEALDKAMMPNVMSVATFDATFAVRLPPIREVIDVGKSATAEARPPDPILDTVVRNHKSMLDGLQHNWTSLRQLVLTDLTRLREQAKIAFESGLEAGIGRKQIAEHYYDLVVWHQESMQSAIISLRTCWSRAAAFGEIAAETQDNLGFVSQSVVRDNPQLRDSYIQSALYRVQEGHSAALNACRADAASQRSSVPRRKSFAESLGPIGRWSGWLLETEQMPVVIIVGLVGFSLLGATVSRAVRAREDGLKGALTLDDLMIVVAGGTTAAIVVFLAAYGGLAVLGGTTGDPNPYVLFVTCLIGAVYSEDVWTWARRKLLSSATRASGQGSNRKSAGRRGARKKN